MKYFCAECQTKHNVTDIVADLYDICYEDIKEKITDIRAMSREDDFLERLTRISRFINNPVQARKHFLFSYDQIIKQLVDVERNGSSIKGTLVLNFQWLLNIYEACGAAAADAEEAAKSDPPVTLLPLSNFSAEARNYVLFSKDMDFIFHQVSPQELVFDYIAPGRQNRSYAYDKTSTKRACPHCGMRLSTVVGKAPETVIAVTGCERSGKTSCITAITSALKSHRYSAYGLTMNVPSHDDQWKLLDNEIMKYDNGFIVTKTPKAQDDVPAYSYMVDLGGEERVITFVDMPGEFWNGENGLSDEFFQQYAGLYQNIDCVWFFVSKLAVHSFDLGSEDAGGPQFALDDIAAINANKHKQNQARLRAESSDSNDTILGSSASKVSTTLHSLRTHLNSHTGKGIPPFAVILTKTEVLYDPGNPAEAKAIEYYNLFPSSGGRLIRNNLRGINNAEMDLMIGYDAENRSRFVNEKNFFDSSAKVRQYLKKYNINLLNAIEQNCPDRFYIAMAAYGHPAAMISDPQKAYAPTPFHEMYPLLWTLAITGGMKIQHGCTWYTHSFMSKLLKTGQATASHGFEYATYDYTTSSDARRKKNEIASDAQQIQNDIAKNLLMKIENGGYTTTEFDHARR